MAVLASALAASSLAEGGADGSSATSPVRRNLVTVLPATQAWRADGTMTEGEYSAVVTGLLDLKTQDLYPFPCEVRLGGDRERFRIAFRLALPPGYRVNPPGRMRDDPALVTGKDAFYLFLRPDSDTTKKGFEGVYGVISANGNLYDAWEKVDWHKGFCQREASLNAKWEVFSKVENGVWVLEASAPWADLRLPPPSEERRFLVSFGFNLQDRQLAWQTHPSWFDHYQAFGHLRVARGGLKLGVRSLGELGRGLIDPRLDVGNAGGESLPYEVTYLVSTPRMVAGEVGTWIFDVQTGAGQKELLRDKSVHFWNPSGTLKPGETQALKESAQLDTPRYYVLEVEAKSGGTPVYYQKIPFNFSPPLVASLSPIPSKDALEARVAFRGAREDERGTLEVRAKDAGGKVVVSQSVPVKGEELVVPLSMSRMAPGKYSVELCLKGRDDRPVYTLTEPFTRWETPSWLKDRAGLEALDPDWVPSSWPALDLKEGSVGMWGRVYRFGADGLLSGMASQGRSLLAAPVVVKYLVGGQERRFTMAAPKVTLNKKGRIEFSQTGASADFDLTATHRVEFDGMDYLTLAVTPKAPTRVDRLWVEFPFVTQPYSMLAAAEGVHGFWWQHGLASDGLFETPRRFTSIWLGNDEVGCTLFAENYKGWLINSTKPRVSLKTDGATRRLNLLLVNEPSQVTRPIEIAFGFQATPVKPMPPRLRDVRAGNAAEPPPYNVLMAHASIWNSGDSKPSPRNWKVLKDLVGLARSRNQQLNPYIGAFFVTPWDCIRRDFPLPSDLNTPYPAEVLLKSKKDATRLEEYFRYERDWNASPARVATVDPETREEVFVTASSSYADFFAGGVREILQHEPDFGGFFFDISTPPMNFDVEKGLAYTTKDGVEEGTFESMATRDFYKRLYWLFDKHRGPSKKPWFIGHQFASSAPYVSFWDMTINGEEIKPETRFGFTDMALQKSMEGNPAALPSRSESAKSYDAYGWRSQFGAQFGVANILLPQYGYNPALKTVEHAREILSITFLHNIPVRPAYIPANVVEEFWSKVEIPFGMADAEFHPYWSNGVKSEPACVKVSYHEKARGGDYLVAVANWSAEEVRGRVRLPPSVLAATECRDMESGEAAKPGANWEVVVKPHDLRVFRFSTPRAGVAPAAGDPARP